MHPSLHNISEVSLDRNIYNKLSLRYIIALICIALVIISSQTLIQKFLKKQLGDSRVVNVAGRQRMLSQNITKTTLLIYYSSDKNNRLNYVKKVKSALRLWQKSHIALIYGDNEMFIKGNNSDTINYMLEKVSVSFNGIVDAVNTIVKQIENNHDVSKSELEPYINRVLKNEHIFLPIMDDIVNQYDAEALQKVKDVMKIETVLLIIALGILVFEFFFIFQPTAVFMKSTIQNLLKSEEKEKQSYKNIIKVKSEEQRFRSSLIFEGQERERRRMSRDLHDGIGQMLTGLKFQVEAISNHDGNLSMEKVDSLKELTTDIIKEIRRVSFNLRPSVLSDYGLSSGIKSIVKELKIYTGTDIEFINETDFNQRLDKMVETHMYRITQEAINNALKYSHSEKIVIRIWHRTELVGISVKDYGVGFEVKEIEGRDLKSEKGHGIFNMKERASYINADLRIKSEKGKGTEIIIYLPLN